MQSRPVVKVASHSIGRGRHSRRLVTAAALMGLSCVAPAASADPGDDLSRGDQIYARGQLAEARAVYAGVLEAHPGHYGALCRLARVESELGEDVKGEERRRLIAASVAHAREAVSGSPEGAEGHAWLAATLGRQALHEGPKTRLALAREIKSEADRALELDPRLARAYHVRGVWNRRIASMSLVERSVARTLLGGVPQGASLENSFRDLQKAVELEPDYVNHRLELARTLQKLKRHADARRELEKAVSLPATSSARDAQYQAEARALLGKLPRS